LLFLSEKLSFALYPMAVTSIVVSIRTPSFIPWMQLIYTPFYVKFFIFQLIMVSSIRFSSVDPDFYEQYYSKIPIERAEFILDRLRGRAVERGDKEMQDVLSAVRKIRIVENWPLGGGLSIEDAFDVPSGILYINKGMTEQISQLQYMIIRRAKGLRMFGQLAYRREHLYYWKTSSEISKFLIYHNSYIGIYLIYEICNVLVNNFLSIIFRLFENPLYRTMKKKDTIKTVYEAIETAEKNIANGKIKAYTAKEFAEEFCFPEDLSEKLLTILPAHKSL